MDKIKTHRDLDVWKLAMDFTIELYKITGKFPREEKYRLVNQIRRAGVSVCSNISEGAARSHNKEFLQFLSIALGSVTEIETQLETAERLEYISSSEVPKETTDRLRKMLIGLIKSVTRNA